MYIIDWRDLGQAPEDFFNAKPDYSAVSFEPVELDVRGVLGNGGMIDGIVDDIVFLPDMMQF